ncbi:sulfatase [Halosimplex carlsbadense 2-9-1]|uniref:Sulfatase n=1 Tax=Halosimplex carlsbadense 2-9-1 TaxID=797114 RepID=M0CKW2_9EURY|nr:sulfatase-like hydrolase/transferase [Halosimplex carlsbadense]ELZ22494.1 sulfatase [Halosimplex carlsbadense 2-9-1]
MDRARPNVLFVCVDALRSDFAFGDYGADKPLFEFFEREGTAFDTMVAAASSTTPCVASYMTGTYPPDHGVLSLRDFSLAEDATTLAEAFDAAGYDTSASVTGPITDDTGLNAGFDRYDYRERDTTVYTDWFDEYRRELDEAEGPWFRYLHLWEAHVHKDLPPDADGDEIDYDAAVRGVFEKVQRLLEVVDLSETVVAITGDHGEAFADGTWRHRAAIIGFNQVPIPFTDKRTRNVRSDVYDQYLRPRGIETEEWYNSLRKASATEFPNAFHRIGHGYHVYDFLTRVPFAVAGPGVSNGGRVNDQVRSVDIFPTLLDAAGVDRPDGVSGQDLLSGSIDHRPAHVRAVGASGERERWLDGVRYDGWKYIQGRNRELCQLFDLESDPEELENVADEFPEVVERLRGIVDEHVARERQLETTAVSEGAEQRMTSRLEDLGYL